MKVLVLGGTGAMGADLVRILHKKSQDVYVTSRSEHNDNDIHYIVGDAQNDVFLKNVLEQKYDVIVDFMNYSTEKFKSRLNLLLESTNQYIFFSSSRVYADNINIIEDSERLIDCTKDSLYLETDEYALAKSRQENLLLESGKTNWTIIRPYITYSNNRLQLGFFEKELWLYRALKGRTVVFPNDIGDKLTTLTMGKDVSNAIACLIGNSNAYGNIYHIMQNQTITWNQVLNVYSSVLGEKLKIKKVANSTTLGKVTGREFQIKYDRLYNRTFNNGKIAKVCPDIMSAVGPEDGLKECLIEFLNGNQTFRDIEWQFEGYADKLTGEKTSLKEIKGSKNKLKYLLARYTTYFEKR